MSVLSSCVMGLDGASYLLLGGCMLVPAWSEALAALYPSMFKRFLLPQQAGGDEAGGDELGAGTREVARLEREDLAYRLLGYLLLLVGLARVITAFYWGCGYVYFGLGTCVLEIGLVCNELLRRDSMLLHRAMAVLLENMAVSILYMGAAAPYCR
jgi:hypothetical protein